VLGTVLVVVLILALLGALPRWPHSSSGGMPRRKAWVSCFSSWSFCCFSDVSEFFGQRAQDIPATGLVSGHATKSSSSKGYERFVSVRAVLTMEVSE
jgi:Protein of unknown function (DUF3309)